MFYSGSNRNTANYSKPPTNISYTPMTSVPDEVKDKFWSLIFAFVFDIDVEFEVAYGRIRNNRPALLSGSKAFHVRLSSLLIIVCVDFGSQCMQRLSLPHLYTCVLVGFRGISLLADQLTLNPCHGRHIRWLTIRPAPGYNSQFCNTWGFWYAYHCLTFSCLHLGTDLENHEKMSLSWECFVTLAKVSGARLCDIAKLEIVAGRGLLPQSPAIF